MIRKNNVLAIAIMITTAVLTPMGFAAQYGGGSGTPEKPYQIWDANDLNEIGLHEEDWDKHFALMADIDMSGYDGREGRQAFNPIGHFSGVFDGGGYVIKNLRVELPDEVRVGMFSSIARDSVLKNLILEGVSIRGGLYDVGGLVGDTQGTIEN